MGFVLKLAMLAVLAVTVQSRPKGSKKYNILMLYADDLGYADIGLRNKDIKTPNLDKLATEGVILTQNYVGHACSPSRHSFMTSRYTYKDGLSHTVIMENLAFCSNLKRKYFPQYLKDVGYNTAAVGKWHLGHCRKECTPTFRGFDSFYGGYGGEGDYLTHEVSYHEAYDWHENNTVDWSAKGKHSQDLVQDRAIKILDEQDGEDPFFLYVSFHNTHSPLLPKQEFLDLYKDLDLPEWRKKYLGLLSGLDYAVGKIVEKLKAKGLYENTLIVFTADNGGDMHEGDNSPFRGGKMGLFEGGVRANSFIHSPLLKKTGYENNGLMHISDWMPTMMSIIGEPLSDDIMAEIDGIDQSNMIMWGGRSKRKEMVYQFDVAPGWKLMGEIAVRNQRYKLIWGFQGIKDGYGLNNTLIGQIPFYVDAVNENKAQHAAIDKREMTIAKRGGPYVFSAQDEEVIFLYSSMVQVTDQQIEDGTGYYMMFDLEEDPSERNDLAKSMKGKHKKARKQLMDIVRKARKEFVGQTEAEGVMHDVEANPKLTGGVLSQWCEEFLPLPTKE